MILEVIKSPVTAPIGRTENKLIMTEDIKTVNKIRTIIDNAVKREILLKIVFSKPADKAVRKSVLSFFLNDGKKYVRQESFMKDGKALHKNFSDGELTDRACLLLDRYGQADILTSSGSCTVMISKSGNIHISDKIAKEESSSDVRVRIADHDRKKTHLLTPSAPFLFPLGITDEKGNIIERRHSKFRQINRFLELVDDIYDKLPENGTLTVCDLCCGKSVLSFAVYWYLTEIRKRKVEMYGVDIKPDVIKLSADIAVSLGMNGLHFICGDVSAFSPPEAPCMVLSLHACDTATDLVLSLAVRYKAKIILSTPCCHHEIFHQLKTVPAKLSAAYGGRSMLRQKLADSLTDGLRSARLELEGYEVDNIELVDPDDTPKNILIRAVAGKKLSENQKLLMRQNYDECLSFFGISPSLDKLIDSK